MKPFKNLKVVELASVLAGPSVGMFFAELGAEVLKIENKKSNGDVTRSWKLASEDQNHPYSAYYSSVNYGKESIFLDVTEAEGYSKTIEYIAKADLVITNFKPGDAKKLKLDFESIKAVNLKIIYGEITGFGTENRIAYDVVLQAETGFLAMNGTANGMLCKMPVALIDLLAAHQLKEGILIALLQQKTKKVAQKVSVSLYDSALASLANQATNYLMANHVAKPMGTLHPNIAPYGELFITKDEKKIVLAVGSDSQFKKLLNVLELNNLVTEPKFLHNQERVKNRTELAKVIADKIILFQRNYLIKLLIKADVPAGAVRNMAEVFDSETAKKQLIVEQKEGNKLQTIKSAVFKIST